MFRRFVPAAAAVAVIATAVSLGSWQLRRADEKRALQARSDAAAASAAVSIAAGAIDAAGLDGKRVVVRGRWVADGTVFIDNRTRNGVAGFHVVTPVRIADSGAHVLVLRGWVARDPRDRLALPAIPTPDDEVAIEGVAQATIAQVLELKASPPPGPGDRIWQNLDFERFGAWSGLQLVPLLVRQSGDQAGADGLFRDWPQAGDGIDKHLGYAFQWFALAAATAGLWVYLNFFRRRDTGSDD